MKKYTKAQKAAYAKRKRRPRRSKLPTRFRSGNKKRMGRTSSIAKKISGLAEKKLIGSVLQAQPSAYNLDAFRTFAMSLGQNLVPGLSALQQLTSQRLWNMTQGDGTNERNGRSLYIQGTSLTHKFEYIPTTITSVEPPSQIAYHGPILTRFMVLQPRTALHGRLHVWDVTRDLFLDSMGSLFGITNLATDFELSQYLINVKDYVVLVDKKFILSPPTTRFQAFEDEQPTPSTTSTAVLAASVNDNYPSMKLIKHHIPVNRNVRYNGDGAGDGPDNFNAGYFVVAISAPVGVAGMPVGLAPVPPNILYSFMGTTSTLDL